MAGSTARLSSALLVADMNDFLSPAQACVLPMGGGAVSEPAGSVLAPIIPRPGDAPSAEPGGEVPEAPAKAAVTLSDCLSCSGCVTSAETVLLSSAHVARLRADVVDADADVRRLLFAVAVLSQQAVASLAARAGLSLGECARRLAGFLRDALGFDAVLDGASGEAFAQRAMAAEFLARFRAGGAGPVVCGACPGWVTYAEKTQGPSVLAALSRVRSPQAAAAALARAALDPGPARRLWVAAVAPCHDRKIEAARAEFADAAGAPDVDCVLTAGELWELLEERGCDLRAQREADLHPAFALVGGGGGFGKYAASGSGGYADYVLRAAARDVLGVALPEGELGWQKASRSGDLQSVVVRSADGSKQLRFALAYGFRSLQSILRKIRRGECDFDYIELMACPSGCNNGGGQLPLVPGEGLRADDARAMKAANSALLKKVQDTFFSAPKVPVEDANEALEKLIASSATVPSVKTTIVSRKTDSGGSLAW